MSVDVCDHTVDGGVDAEYGRPSSSSRPSLPQAPAAPSSHQRHKSVSEAMMHRARTKSSHNIGIRLVENFEKHFQLALLKNC